VPFACGARQVLPALRGIGGFRASGGGRQTPVRRWLSHSWMGLVVSGLLGTSLRRPYPAYPARGERCFSGLFTCDPFGTLLAYNLWCVRDSLRHNE
jgi:hypothetical protein